jgi:hypothetical protein
MHSDGCVDAPVRPSGLISSFNTCSSSPRKPLYPWSVPSSPREGVECSHVFQQEAGTVGVAAVVSGHVAPNRAEHAMAAARAGRGVNTRSSVTIRRYPHPRAHHCSRRDE